MKISNWWVGWRKVSNPNNGTDNKIFRVEKTKLADLNKSCPNLSDQESPCKDSDLLTRSSLVRNTYLRQSVRKKQFLKSMITERGGDLETKSFSVSRFNLSDQIISESVEDCDGTSSDDSAAGVACDEDDDEVPGGVGVLDETRSEGDLNCSTSGVSSLSCSSLDSLHAADQSFYT